MEGGLVIEMRGRGICPPECLCRRNGCQCGSIGVLSILPLEILEQILLYEDPISLLAVERSSRGMAKLVAHCWKHYCKQNNLMHRTPTPMCVGWKTGRDSNFSYDRAVLASESPDQKWRLLAVRFFLGEQNICVGCQSNYGEFRLKDDVLLCYRCSKIFCLYMTQEVEITLTTYGINPSDLSRSFAPVLLSDVIISLRTAGQNERHCLKKIRPYLGCKGHSTCSLESISVQPSGNSGNGIYFIPQRGCVVTGPNTCSCLDAAGKHRRQCCGPENDTSSSTIKKKSKKIVTYSLIVSILFSMLHLGIIFILLSKHSSIRFINMAFEPFLQLACINGFILIVSYFPILFILKRLFQAESTIKKSSSCTILLQCVIVASLITQITEILMTSNFASKFDVSGTDRLSILYSKHQSDTSSYNTIKDLVEEYSCCIPYSITAQTPYTTGMDARNQSTIAQNVSVGSTMFNYTCVAEVQVLNDCVSTLGAIVMPWLVCFITMAALMSCVHIGVLLLAQKIGYLMQKSRNSTPNV